MIAVFGLSLHGAADIAQIVIASAAVGAFAFAAWEVRISRTNARRSRVYDYSDRFNQLEILRACADFTEFWKKDGAWSEYQRLETIQKQERRMLPNLIEEVAFIYNRRLLDRDVAAELLGIYVERLWAVAQPLALGLRQERNRPDVYSEWEEMQRDTQERQLRGVRRAERRRAWRKLLKGN
jgi:hypothetical protein